MNATLAAKKYRNLRVSKETGEILDRINEVLERPSANNLADLMIREYGLMVENPAERRVPKLAVDYDARRLERPLLPGVVLLQSQSQVQSHFGHDLPKVAETPDSTKAQARPRKRSQG